MAEILKQSKTYLVMLSQDELDVLAFALGARYGQDKETLSATIAHDLFTFFGPHRLTKGCGRVIGKWKFKGPKDIDTFENMP